MGGRNVGGQAGCRGYVVQALACLLEMLKAEKEWSTVTIEPLEVSEKIDILWEFSDGTRKASQIKSSISAMNVADVRAWADDFKANEDADEYELILIGPVSGPVSKMRTHNGVSIPTPIPLNLAFFIERAAHQLDLYLEVKGISRIPPFAREMLINALGSVLLVNSTSGTEHTREELDGLMTNWILAQYPSAVSRAVDMQCEALWNILLLPRSHPHLGAQPLIIRLELVNDGVRTAVIEGLYLEIVVEGQHRWYRAASCIDWKKYSWAAEPAAPSDSEVTQGEFAIGSHTRWQGDLMFVPTGPRGAMNWQVGNIRVNLLAKFADRGDPVQLRGHDFFLDQLDLEKVGRREPIHKVARTPEPWIEVSE